MPENIYGKIVRLSQDEEEQIKADLLLFIHNVATGEFNSPEQVNNFTRVLELTAKFFG